MISNVNSERSFIHAICWINFNIFNGKFISFSIDQQFILFSILQIPSINSNNVFFIHDVFRIHRLIE